MYKLYSIIQVIYLLDLKKLSHIIVKPNPERERCPCNRHSSKSCQFVSYSALAFSVGLVFGVYFVLRCNPVEESWCGFKDHEYHELSKESEYATLTLLVLLFAIGVIFLYVRSVRISY